MAKWSGKRKKVVLLALAVIALVAVAISQMFSGGNKETASLLTEPVSIGDIEKTVLSTGIIKPSLQVSVGAQVNGQLKKLYVKQGDRVKKGDLLAEIDPTLQQNELRTSEAQLVSSLAQRASTRVLIKQYQQELKRQQRMFRDGAGVRSDLEKAQAQYNAQLEQLRMNEAQITQSETAVEKAKANVGYTQILAPMDGEVLGIVTKEGQTVVSSQTAPTILVLADMDTMTVHTRISEADILKVQPGQPLWFYVLADPKRRYEGTMGNIQSAPDEALMEQSSSMSSSQQQSAVYYNGVFDIDNSEHLLRTYMTAQVFIITEQAKGVPRVPMTALGQRKDQNTYQVRVKKGDSVETRWIKTGVNDRLYAEVKEGLQEGEEVVIGSTIAMARK
ncbi:efflux RND transporter periplasmic adaptor subunit [Enterobacillus tribolii]|uniref:Macrolide-specific efflux system membrane fusion protein n=1 Tax=Enterobacillus tribolii TaxID=1487935 RepID=A0A370QQL2_9GAMM|nr:efflux RND transporter periplasmic adaptor subunit [Enterobacillus tribolii]MBW7981694.1 efflux RND transporter periplasmic adaptor subunit [Enterobacillus tribolii]RDK91073.1 macrolide-specific efflux system membrane fusion protein [Enterobacillus tribolii]